MDLDQRLAISYYKPIAAINEPHHVYLVQHQETKKIAIKKVLDVYNLAVYAELYRNPIAGTPQIINYYEEAGQLTVIEEYISGTSLQDKISHTDIAPNDMLQYMLDLCTILEQLHLHNPAIIHRDVKPSNVIITSYNRAVLLDFNAAKYHTAAKDSDTILLGTQGYAAPEQYGFGQSSPQTDIYSIGILLKEMAEASHCQNPYIDAVTAKSPLGPFTLQASNPFSSKPGGFMTGAGHGSTIADRYGNWWHASTMRISVNYDFERRVGLFPAGFDKDGVLYCNQNFADYPHRIPAGKFDAASQQPEWMLLSYKKPVTASSTAEGSSPALAVNEDCRSWWSAAGTEPGEWLCVDLGKESDIRAIQVNMADEKLVVDFPADSYGDTRKTRHIETRPQISHYTIETSVNGADWTIRETVARECSNGYFEFADGICARYVRVTGGELPYGQALRISGLRVFGNGEGAKPAQAEATGIRVDALDAKIIWQHIENAQGCNVRYGIAPDKLYLSWLVYDADEVTLSTLTAGQEYYICVDSFNENGITPGKTFKLEG